MSSAGSISVVIPVRDGERYLGEAIESVLGGTVPAAEVIVVDDGSTDSTAATAERIGDPVRVLRRPAAGIAAATNAGLAEASGDLVAFIDADDVWTPDKLELQLGALEDDPSLDAVFGLAREFYSPDLPASERERIVLRPGDHAARVRGTALLRSEMLDRTGPFDETLAVGEFVDWHDRAAGLGMRSIVLDRLVLHRRLHASNHGRTAAHARGDYVRVARAALLRRRAAEAEA